MNREKAVDFLKVLLIVAVFELFWFFMLNIPYWLGMTPEEFYPQQYRQESTDGNQDRR